MTGVFWLVFKASAGKALKEMCRVPSYFHRSLFYGPVWAATYFFSIRAFIGNTEASDTIWPLLLGIGAWIWLHNTIWDLSNRLRAEKLRGTLDSVLVAPGSLIAWLLGSTFVVALFHLATLALAFAILRLILGLPFRPHWLLMAVTCLLSSGVIWSFSLLGACATLYMRSPTNTLALVVDALLIASGAVYPVRLMPSWARTLSSLLPSTWVVRAIQGSYGGTRAADALPVLVVLSGLTLSLIIGSLLLMRATERRMRAHGTLYRV